MSRLPPKLRNGPNQTGFSSLVSVVLGMNPRHCACQAYPCSAQPSPLKVNRLLWYHIARCLSSQPHLPYLLPCLTVFKPTKKKSRLRKEQRSLALFNKSSNVHTNLTHSILTPARSTNWRKNTKRSNFHIKIPRVSSRTARPRPHPTLKPAGNAAGALR